MHIGLETDDVTLMCVHHRSGKPVLQVATNLCCNNGKIFVSLKALVYSVCKEYKVDD